MKCPDCGKELKEVGVLTDEELLDFQHVREMTFNAQQALRSEVINKMNFTEGQVFEYFRAAFDEMAKASFLDYCIRQELKKKYKLDDSYFFDLTTGRIYLHINS